MCEGHWRGRERNIRALKRVDRCIAGIGGLWGDRERTIRSLKHVGKSKERIGKRKRT